jgi:hypothetical protein
MTPCTCVHCGHEFAGAPKGGHRVVAGDATSADAVKAAVGLEKADCVFTSPPYGVGVDYGPNYEDTVDNLRLMLPILAEYGAMW